MSFLNPIWHAPARTCSVITDTCMGWGRLHSSTLVFVTRLCPASPHSPSLLHSVFALNHITPSPHVSHPLTGIIFPLVSEDTVPSGSPEVFPSPSLAYTLPSQSWVVYSLSVFVKVIMKSVGTCDSRNYLYVWLPSRLGILCGQGLCLSLYSHCLAKEGSLFFFFLSFFL